MSSVYKIVCAGRTSINNVSLHLLKNPRFKQTLLYSTTPMLLQKDIAKQADPEKVSTAKLSSSTHKPNGFEQTMLVWCGKYKTKEEIPTYINQDVMDRVRNKFRIRFANIMMALTAVGCLVMVLSGKEAQQKGDSVVKQNLDWHKEYNQKAAEEAAASTKK